MESIQQVPETYHSKPSILVAGTNRFMQEIVTDTLVKEGYIVAQWHPENSNYDILKCKYDLAIFDIAVQGANGFDFHSEIIRYSSDTKFIVVAENADAEKMEWALNLGIHTFLPKTIGINYLRFAVKSVFSKTEDARKDIELKPGDAGNMGILGNSIYAQTVRKKILEVAPLEISVLVTGESGTGKEVVAECIHKYSRRSSKVFIPLNIASITPNLIESELFGHIKGAFTGAIKNKFGFFEAAKDGTLFIDEIGELPLSMQSKLLRVLDRGEFYRVGESLPRSSNARIICATNQNLEEMVMEGRFRRDLFYRIKGAEIKLKPLKQRREDVSAFVYHYLEDGKYSITKDAMQQLKGFEWLGNIRELKSLMTFLKGVCSNRTITVKDIENIIGIKSVSVADGKDEIIPYYHFKEQAEKKYFQSLMDYTGGNISKASIIAKLHRKNLREKLKHLGIYSRINNVPKNLFG